MLIPAGQMNWVRRLRPMRTLKKIANTEESDTDPQGMIVESRIETMLPQAWKWALSQSSDFLRIYKMRYGQPLSAPQSPRSDIHRRVIALINKCQPGLLFVSEVCIVHTAYCRLTRRSVHNQNESLSGRWCQGVDFDCCLSESCLQST